MQKGTLKMETSFEMEPADGLKYPEWQRPLQEAIVELDKDKLKTRLAAVETAITNRLQAISRSPDHRAERQAIEDARALILAIRRDNFGLPDQEQSRSGGKLDNQAADSDQPAA